MAIEKITGIVIDIVRHTDRANVITLFTSTRGRLSFISPVGKGRTGLQRNSRLMLLSAIEVDVNFRENRPLQMLGRIAPAAIWRNIYFDPVKSSIAMFMSEFLNRYLRDAQPDSPLWEYTLRMISLLDEAGKETVNVHLAFLKGCLYFAGIYPEISDYESGDYFDMRSGLAVAERPDHRDFLIPSEAARFMALLHSDLMDSAVYRILPGGRREALGWLLRYYSVHFPGLSSLKSPAILAELFS